MRCPRCQEEVLLARTCPYCGVDMPQAVESPSAGDFADQGSAADAGGSHDSDGLRGSFRRSASSNQERPRVTLANIIRYLFDPSVPALPKLLLLGGIIYILSPVDVVPDFLPIFGWLDDAAVIGALWAFLNTEVARYLAGK